MLSGYRTTIAESLSTVEGVNGYQYRPATPRPGDAWPLLGSLDRGPGLAFYVTWRVYVFLPQDERQASEWIDAKYEAVVDALEPVGFVDRIEPVKIDGSDQYAIQILMRGE